MLTALLTLCCIIFLIAYSFSQENANPVENKRKDTDEAPVKANLTRSIRVVKSA